MSLFGDLNEVKILGNLTADPELRYTSQGTAVVNFSVATNRSFRQNDEWKDDTQYHNVVAWANLAENFTQRAHKGTRVLITGRLQTRSWEDNEGNKKYKTEIIADDIYLIARFEKGKSEDLPKAKAVEESNSNQTSNTSQKDKENKEDIIEVDDLPF